VPAAPAAGGGFFDFLTKKQPTPVQQPVPTQNTAANVAPKMSIPKMSMPKMSIPKMSMPNMSMPKMSTPKMTMPKFGGEVSEDRRMTKRAFDTLIQEMVQLQGDLCPQTGKMSDPFTNEIMPDLSCPGKQISGGKRRKRTIKRRKNKKQKTRKFL
jgi:hypothetical protein